MMEHGAQAKILDHKFMISGGCPTWCQGSLSMWPPAFGGVSNEVKAGKVLNRNILDPPSPAIRSSNRIIECMRTAVVVMIGTKKVGKPKWLRKMPCSAIAV